MAYFLKKTKKKKGIYLQIYEGVYEPAIGNVVQRSHRALGYLHELQEEGIEAPIEHFQQEVDRLNEKDRARREADRFRKIGERTPERYLGYFPLKAINDNLKVKGYLDLMQSPFDFGFNVYEILASLSYARLIDPCSKYKTFHDVLPLLYDDYAYSESQMYDGLRYIGSEYEKVIEIYNHQVNALYRLDSSVTYFDCTNFYFEIDKEDELRRKGPSKEMRHDPLVALGLLLDAQQIPIGMKLFPGNESEKPQLRKVIGDLKSRHHVEGRTIRVADKGLNCADNIMHALRDKDGYIFSKSVKQMPQTEQEWVLLAQDYERILDEEGNLLYQIKSCVDDFPYKVQLDDGSKQEILLREKRVVTFNPKLARKKRVEIGRQIDKAQRLSLSMAKRSEYGDSAKYVNFVSLGEDGEETDRKAGVSLNREAIEKDLRLAGFNCMVTSEIHMDAHEIYGVYHNLWRIEESFKVMKSYLDARPVFVQHPDSIAGHFLICYLSILLMRLFQFKILDNQVSSETIIHFIRHFRAVKCSPRKWINITKSSQFLKDFAQQSGLPLTSYFLTEAQIKSIFNKRL
ncbi:MAG: IS1634 family transposase [Clostridiaceae bacterium]|nr:IS1634 family transposase [Clostridiaceae bacterium]